LNVEIKIKNIKDQRLKRRKQRYKLAKALGFTSEEAGILAGWSESRIHELAVKRISEVQNGSQQN
jgi:hypothetical protein